MKKIIVLMLMITVLICWAQQVSDLAREGKKSSGYDEKSIMSKQAKRYTSRRNYEKANNIYREMIEKYPDDWEIVQDLVNNLMRMSEYDNAQQLLDEKRELFPDYNYLRFKIPLLIRQGDLKKAEKAGDEYLAQNSTNVKVYQDLARIFSGSRQYEHSADILERARKLTNDEYLYTLDLARDYQSMEKHHEAAREYLKHLEKNKHYLHYVMNNLKGILSREHKVINTIEDFAQNIDNQYVLEAYALSLGHIQQYDKALTVYDKLESIKLLNFAEELAKMKRYDTALAAYSQYEQRESSPDLVAEAQIARAEIYLKQQDYISAEAELTKIYENKKLNKGKYFYKTQAAKQARLLLAELSLRLNRSPQVVTRYLMEAREVARNNMEKKEIGLALIDYQIKTAELDAASEQLTELLKDEESGTSIYKHSLFYAWEIALMQKDAAADSLLGELLIKLPQSELTTEALYLTQIMTSLPEEQHDHLYDAWRLHGLYKNDLALQRLQQILADTDNEEIKLLAAQWQQNQPEIAQQWWLQDYENALLGQYAKMMVMENTIADSTRQELITDFLKENPQSIFAPRFRHELNYIIEGRKQ